MSELASIDVRRDGRLCVVTVSGEIDMSNAHVLRERALALMSNEDQALALDFSALSYVDSAGLRTIFELSRLLRERSQRMFLVIVQESQPWRVVEIAGVGEQAQLVDDMDQLRAAVHAGDAPGLTGVIDRP
jgi:anti-anti-sigma factor